MRTRTAHTGDGSRQPDRLRTGEARWSYRGRPVRVAVTDRAALPAARRLVARELSAMTGAVDPYRGELARVHRAAGRPVPVGALLADLVRVALATAETTDGAVDPTVGVALLRRGRPDRWQPVCGSAYGWQPVCPPASGDSAAGGGPAGCADWRAVTLRGNRLAIPPTLWLDLGGTDTAYLAQRCADRIAPRLAGGALVGIGSRVASAGAAPPDGWSAPAGDPAGGLTSGGLATARAYVPGRSGVLDPRTGLAPSAPWRSVTVAAGDTVRAAALAVGALVHGADGPRWLAGSTARWWRLGGGS